MLVVSAVIKIKADKIEETTAAAVEMMDATLQEAGCITYQFCADLRDPTEIRIFEEWESEEALLAHFQTPHMATFGGKMPGLLDGPVKATKYFISKTEPIG